MIEGRPRESLVQYENPIEVRSRHHQSIWYRFRQARIPRTRSRRLLDVSLSEVSIKKHEWTMKTEYSYNFLCRFHRDNT
jgi:hypothetical protein